MYLCQVQILKTVHKQNKSTSEVRIWSEYSQNIILLRCCNCDYKTKCASFEAVAWSSMYFWMLSVTTTYVFLPWKGHVVPYDVGVVASEQLYSHILYI